MKKKYSYPGVIRMIKNFIKCLIPIMILFSISLAWTTHPGEDDSTVQFYLGLLTIPIFAFLLTLFLYSWCNITTSEEGIWVEFIFREIFIPWKTISGVHHIGSDKYGTWLVMTNKDQLSSFHRIYGLVYKGAFQPGFVIHPQLILFSELISEIRKKHRLYGNQRSDGKSEN